MILYNVTVSIDESAEQDWLEWMRSKHIPDVIATGCFIEGRLSRIHAEEQGGLTYAVSYVAVSQDRFDEYQAKHAPTLQKEHTERYSGRFAAFRTMMTIVEEFKP
ncbi:MAG: DUF4286 family protein [Fluviicola sp.]